MAAPEASSGPSELDERLAEIDRRLRAIQSDLTPAELAGADPAVGHAPDSSVPDWARTPPPAPSGVLPGPPPGPAPGPAPAPPPPSPAPDPSPPTPAPGPPGPPTPDPSPPTPSPDPGPGVAAAPPDELHGRLVAAIQRLLEAFQGALETLGAGSTSAVPPPSPTVTAGPFSGTQELHDFERALAEIEGVSEVSLRGFEDGDRAILDVRLAARKP